MDTFCKNNPWKNDEAFLPMFCDSVEISRKNGTRCTVDSCVFPLEDTDPFFDNNDPDSRIKTMNVLVQKTVWNENFGKEKPEIGAKVKTVFGEEYGIAEVVQEQNWYRLFCRSK